MAMAGLGWSPQDLSGALGVSWRTVQKIARTDDVPSPSDETVAAIETALQDLGVVFLPTDGNGPGVRIRRRS